MEGRESGSRRWGWTSSFVPSGPLFCFVFCSMLFGKADGTVGTRPSWKGIKDFCLSWGAARELNQPCDIWSWTGVNLLMTKTDWIRYSSSPSYFRIFDKFVSDEHVGPFYWSTLRCLLIICPVELTISVKVKSHKRALIQHTWLAEYPLAEFHNHNPCRLQWLCCTRDRLCKSVTPSKYNFPQPVVLSGKNTALSVHRNQPSLIYHTPQP